MLGWLRYVLISKPNTLLLDSYSKSQQSSPDQVGSKSIFSHLFNENKHFNLDAGWKTSPGIKRQPVSRFNKTRLWSLLQ